MMSMKKIVFMILCLMLVSVSNAQEEHSKKDTLKKHHFTLFGFVKENKNIHHKKVQIEDTLYVGFAVSN